MLPYEAEKLFQRNGFGVNARPRLDAPAEIGAQPGAKPVALRQPPRDTDRRQDGPLADFGWLPSGMIKAGDAFVPSRDQRMEITRSYDPVLGICTRYS